MQYRYFEQISTGDRTGPIFMSEEISGDPVPQAADIGAALSWAPDDVRAVTVTDDPGPGNVTLPVPDPEPVDPDDTRLQTALDDPTTSELNKAFIRRLGFKETTTR